MHLKVHGPLEPVNGERLAQLADDIALTGRGGAGFPFGRKLRAVASAAIRRGIRPVVVVNASEGEPACRKDTVLVCRAPHLVLDGALLAAEALGARTLVVAVTRDSTEASMRAAFAERGLTDKRELPPARACGPHPRAHGLRRGLRGDPGRGRRPGPAAGPP